MFVLDKANYSGQFVSFRFDASASLIAGIQGIVDLSSSCARWDAWHGAIIIVNQLLVPDHNRECSMDHY